LYDDKIRFSEQPIALVLAEDSETAKFAASLVRVKYEEQAHVTDLQQRLDKAVHRIVSVFSCLGKQAVIQ